MKIIHLLLFSGLLLLNYSCTGYIPPHDSAAVEESKIEKMYFELSNATNKQSIEKKTLVQIKDNSLSSE